VNVWQRTARGIVFRQFFNLNPHGTMPGLTVTEKEHWKDRIARRIDRMIDALWGEDPNLEERIDREARQQALDSLGLAELQAELDEIERQAETGMPFEATQDHDSITRSVLVARSMAGSPDNNTEPRS
jgi:hypothetical protein